MKDPDLEEFDRWQSAAGGNIRLVTLAPERRGAIEFIAALARQRVVVSLGYANASAADIDEAIGAGATVYTHLGNGCPAEFDRHDNIVQRLLARDELTACLIPEGIHLPPFVLKNLFQAKPPGKVILTTDAMAAAGAPPGRYRLGALETEVGADGVVRQLGSRNFAGSSLAPDRGVRNAADWLGLSEAASWALGSDAMARVFGVELPPISGLDLP
jgi:N-acetylglucosamine-6-phosphate deacetylase